MLYGLDNDSIIKYTLRTTEVKKIHYFQTNYSKVLVKFLSRTVYDTCPSSALPTLSFCASACPTIRRRTKGHFLFLSKIQNIPNFIHETSSNQEFKFGLPIQNTRCISVTNIIPLKFSKQNRRVNKQQNWTHNIANHDPIMPRADVNFCAL
jgi:hypothetical protein